MAKIDWKNVALDAGIVVGIGSVGVALVHPMLVNVPVVGGFIGAIPAVFKVGTIALPLGEFIYGGLALAAAKYFDIKI